MLDQPKANLSEDMLNQAKTSSDFCVSLQGLVQWETLWIASNCVAEVVTVDFGGAVISYVHGQYTEVEKEKIGEMLCNRVTVHYITSGVIV